MSNQSRQRRRNLKWRLQRNMRKRRVNLFLLDKQQKALAEEMKKLKAQFAESEQLLEQLEQKVEAQLQKKAEMQPIFAKLDPIVELKVAPTCSVTTAALEIGLERNEQPTTTKKRSWWQRMVAMLCSKGNP